MRIPTVPMVMVLRDGVVFGKISSKHPAFEAAGRYERAWICRDDTCNGPGEVRCPCGRISVWDRVEGKWTTFARGRAPIGIVSTPSDPLGLDSPSFAIAGQR